MSQKKTRTRQLANVQKKPEVVTTLDKPEEQTASVKKEPTVKAFLQFSGKEISYEDITAKTQSIWTEELGNDISSLENLDIYMKPEDNSIYYVFNGEYKGKIEL